MNMNDYGVVVDKAMIDALKDDIDDKTMDIEGTLRTIAIVLDEPISSFNGDIVHSMNTMSRFNELYDIKGAE